MRLLGWIPCLVCLLAGCSGSGGTSSSGAGGSGMCGLTADSSLTFTGTKTGGDSSCADTLTIPGLGGDAGGCTFIPSADGCSLTIDCNAESQGDAAVFTGTVMANGHALTGNVTVSVSAPGLSRQCEYSVTGAFD